MINEMIEKARAAAKSLRIFLRNRSTLSSVKSEKRFMTTPNTMQSLPLKKPVWAFMKTR